ncbi:MAG TPA: hypothetical protein VMA77_26160 [Solirubrobacteraceae bacterium]|nr:hypothetical protein [Solirubrobacteraceae bacterium]
MAAGRPLPTVPTMFGAIFNLNHPAHTIHWHFIELSVANVVVIILMIVVFAAAVLLPFPHHATRGGSQ